MGCVLALAGVMSDSDTVTIEESDIIDGVVASLNSLPIQAVTFEDIKRDLTTSGYVPVGRVQHQPF